METMTLKTFGRWNVRIVRQNDHYGREKSLVHNGSDPLIEFYDNRYKDDGEWKRGQFVARYYAETLFEDCYTYYKWGLQLDGGIPGWYVDQSEIAVIYRWLREQLTRYRFTARQLSNLNFFRKQEHLEADWIQNALARAAIRKMREEGHGRCYLGKYNRDNGEPSGLQEYRHGMIRNFQYDFAIPEFDLQIQDWLLEYQKHSGNHSLIDKITGRILDLNGCIVFWS